MLIFLFHPFSQIVKDCIWSFEQEQAPECIGKDSLLASAKNGLAVKILSKGKEVLDEPVVDNAMNRQKGWERMVLQILFLGPSNLLEPNATFAQMSQKLIVSPIVKTLVFSKVPEKVMLFAFYFLLCKVITFCQGSFAFFPSFQSNNLFSRLFAFYPFSSICEWVTYLRLKPLCRRK
ncbi:uncharacterized protein LOC104887378 [Beta vulgaris subsp. vulgaris]|uniref:uncharacterized protein LOC104887378 n=1 Tax=Beta vulgaris subsp. vulgaris TaxID=3555 RepID=UPI0020366E10|nr:uncharacterized protein LOC104887378 [Beta vulgaris subsp. vulgaris]